MIDYSDHTPTEIAALITSENTEHCRSLTFAPVCCRVLPVFTGVINVLTKVVFDADFSNLSVNPIKCRC